MFVDEKSENEETLSFSLLSFLKVDARFSSFEESALQWFLKATNEINSRRQLQDERKGAS